MKTNRAITTCWCALAFGACMLQLSAENLYRTQINDGEWEYWETLADAVGVVSQQCLVASVSTIDIEMLNDDETTFDGALNLGAYISGKTKHYKRYVNFRSCPSLNRRFVLKKAATAAKMKLCCHGSDTYWTFDNVIFDGGAKWSDPDDYLSTAQEAGGIGAGKFIDMDNGIYLNHVVLTNMTLRNCQMPTGNDGFFSVAYNLGTLTIEDGAEISDCRGGYLLHFGRRLASIYLRGGVITRCGGGSSGGLTYLSGSAATATQAHGTRLFSGTVITNNRVAAQGVIAGDAESQFRFSGAPVIRENYRADGTTPANVYAIAHTNVIVTGALTSPEESIGVYSSDATKLGDVFAVLETGVAGEGIAAFGHDSGDTSNPFKGTLSAGGEPVWTNGTIRVITYEVAGWEGYVDGQDHAPTAKILSPETAVASYALSSEGPWSTEKPQLTETGDYTLYVRIEAPNCPTVNDSVTVTVHPTSYVPANKWRVRLGTGAWQDAADWAAVENVLSNFFLVSTPLTADVELMSFTETLDRELIIGYYKNGTTKHSYDRVITFRSRSDNGQRYTIKRTAQAARFVYAGHGTTRLVFQNIVFDGGANWSDQDDLTSLVQDADGIPAHAKDFFGVNSYVGRYCLDAGAVFTNLALSASTGFMSMSSVSDNGLYLLPGALVTDCRGGSFVNFARHTGNFIVGGEITRCSSPNSLFSLSTSSGVLSGYKHGSHVVTNGYVHGNVVGNSGNVLGTDKYCHVSFAGTPIVTGNRRANGTAANVYAATATNLTLQAALDRAAGARVGVRIGTVNPFKPALGEAFGDATGFADDLRRLNPAAAFYPEDRPTRIGGVKDGNLVWAKDTRGAVLLVK